MDDLTHGFFRTFCGKLSGLPVPKIDGPDRETTVILSLGQHRVDLRPFILATLGWGLLSAVVLTFMGGDVLGALRSWGIYFALAVTDLFFLVKIVAALMHLMSDQGAKNRTAYAIQAFVFGGLKLICLGMIGLCLWKFPSTSSGGILFGLGTLVVVPLLGGFLWSQAELKKN